MKRISKISNESIPWWFQSFAEVQLGFEAFFINVVVVAKPKGERFALEFGGYQGVKLERRSETGALLANVLNFQDRLARSVEFKDAHGVIQ